MKTDLETDLDYSRFFISIGFSIPQVVIALQSIEKCKPLSVAIYQAHHQSIFEEDSHSNL